MKSRNKYNIRTTGLLDMVSNQVHCEYCIQQLVLIITFAKQLCQFMYVFAFVVSIPGLFHWGLP